MLNIPLMENNITREDLQEVITFLGTGPILTQNQKVREFEAKFSEWLGVSYSLFVNSGSSANYLTLSLLKELLEEEGKEGGEIILPPLTWVSDILSVLRTGFRPVFADIDLKNLSMREEEILRKIGPRTRAVFLTHIMGFCGLSTSLLQELEKRGIYVLEDACESIGSTYQGRKLGTFGLISNFSFYYGHHLSTIEGGMVCTNSEKIYQMGRMMRSHGMVREATDEQWKNKYRDLYPDCRPEFIFAYQGFNFRNNEIGAVIGLHQLQRLDGQNIIRNRNFNLFLDHLCPDRYFVDYDRQGMSNYALILILRHADDRLRDKVVKTFMELKVEFRQGTSGGGNQLRQPYLRKLKLEAPENFPMVEYVHFYGFYLGNYPSLEEAKIGELCKILNQL